MMAKVFGLSPRTRSYIAHDERYNSILGHMARLPNARGGCGGGTGIHRVLQLLVVVLVAVISLKLSSTMLLPSAPTNIFASTRVDGAPVDIAMLLLQDVDVGEKVVDKILPSDETLDASVHITHVFSSFSTRAGTENDIAQAIVQKSWQHAAHKAAKHDIRIEFIDAYVAEEANDNEHVRQQNRSSSEKSSSDQHKYTPLQNESSSFAKRVELTRWIKEPYDGRHLPLIGDILSAGKRVGRGRWLIYTNMDIGVMPDFYLHALGLAERDDCDVQVQREVFKKCKRFLRFCLNHLGISRNTDELCWADVASLYENIGGVATNWNNVLAKLTAATVVGKSSPAGETSSTTKGEKSKFTGKTTRKEAAYRPLEGTSFFTHSTSNNINNDSQNSYEKKEDDVAIPIQTVDCKSQPRAITITRMDLDINAQELYASAAAAELSTDSSNISAKKIQEKATLLLVKDSLDAAVVELALRRVHRYDESLAHPHPGNDCFVMRRVHIPTEILTFAHPLGFPRWGKWLPDAFKHHNISFRRYHSSQHSKSIPTSKSKSKSKSLSPSSSFSRQGNEPYDQIMYGSDGRLTWHLGVGGPAANNWPQLFDENPYFITFLQANWYMQLPAYTSSNFQQTPARCAPSTVFYSAKLCSRSPDPAFCDGFARLSCERFLPHFRRDVKRYVGFCRGEAVLRKVKLRRPFCEFCRMLLGQFGVTGEHGEGTGDWSDRASSLRQKEAMRVVQCREGRAEECANADCKYYEDRDLSVDALRNNAR